MEEGRKLIAPDLPGGMRDFLPREAIARQWMLDTVRSVFERFGFVPIKTPAIEFMSVLSGNDPNFDMSVYSVRTRSLRQGESLGLRFDHTVPLARYFAAHNNELPRPFKRYASGEAWRGEKSQAGRYNEFGQFDADIVGASTMLADAEIIALMVATLRALGVEQFEVRYNNRKLLDGLPAYAGYDPVRHKAVLRVIDKFAKIGVDGVRDELALPEATEADLEAWKKAGNEGRPPSGLGLPEVVVDKISDFLALPGGMATDVMLSLFGGNTVAEEGLRELLEVMQALQKMGVVDHVRFDQTIARGLDYYTGTVFETFLTDLPQFGSVFSGGRFDGLVARFMEANMPAVGASIGIDRLFVALGVLNKLPARFTTVQALVTVMDQTNIGYYLQMVSELRSAGINTSLWMGEDNSFKAQLAFAAKEGIPVVLIVGENEMRANRVAVKDMVLRQQISAERADLVRAVRTTLGFADND